MGSVICIGMVVWLLVAIPFWMRTKERRGNRKRLDDSVVWARKYYERSDEKRQAMDLVYAINKALPWIAISSLEPSSKLTEDLKLEKWDRVAVRIRYLEVANRTVEAAQWMACETIEDLVRYLCDEP